MRETINFKEHKAKEWQDESSSVLFLSRYILPVLAFAIFFVATNVLARKFQKGDGL
jgi:hypothetical protein